MQKIPRLAFVTIGQTPRIDIVPEMVAEIRAGRQDLVLDIVEFGVLDGLDESGLDALRAKQGEHSFATRLNDGTEIVSSKERTEERLNHLLQEIDGQGFDLIVLLCTGTKIEPLQNTLVVEAQRIVDATVEALAQSARHLGIILPLERQVKEFAERHVYSGKQSAISASPYAGDDIAARAAPLADCDLAIMHCMGYSAAMLKEARQAIKGPVLLSRAIVAGIIRQML